MKTKIILVAAAIILTSSLGIAKTLSVYQSVNGKETLLAQKDITNDDEGVMIYNLCAGMKDLTAQEIQSCESNIKYLNSNNGSTDIIYKHKEFSHFHKTTGQKIAIMLNLSGNARPQSTGNFLNDSTPEKSIRMCIE